jgi:holo-[acyl-carrier protein] synthase
VPKIPKRWIGLGVDILEVGRMESFLKDHKDRLERVFSPSEKNWAFSKEKPEERLALLFAGKEAVFKSLGLSPTMFFRWREIEIVPGKTLHKVILQESLKKLMNKGKTATLHVLWSLKRGYAFAVAVRKG